MGRLTKWVGPVRGRLRILLAGRFCVCALVLLVLLLLGTGTRVGLALFNGFAFDDWAAFSPLRLPLWLALGFVYDLGVASFVLLPFALVAWLAPDSRRGGQVATALNVVLAAAVFGLALFVALAEFVFWNEFGTRFNFIAVDYLLYTSEVIGNIRESYPVPLMLGGLVAATVLLLLAVLRPLRRAGAPAGMSFAGRSTRMALLALLSLQAYIGLDARYKDFSPHAPSVQLAGNGWFEFLHAFWHNEIDYPQFYRTLPPAQADAVLRREFGLADAGAPPTVVPLAIARHVQGRDAQKRLNVVLISVESLSADFLGSFGNDRNLTPRLDALARESLLFTRLYATGTRTVRGLEAISLSLPPTPGHSVVKRPNNDNLYTLGEVFAEKGYEPLYIYGGYSYFDNMKTFFAGNGYTVVDRAALPREDVHYENIWGVADEDLFTLALRQLDARHRAGRPFFAHIMTTSNHRPFSYPAGRIDLPAGSREGAVKYTDWAIGNFIDRARATPWFDDTVFVILADHCASSRGRTELPIDRFHIPLLIYAPRHLVPARIEQLASQIDVGPTLLGLLNFDYTSRFFGQDILAEGQRQQRALLANYQTVGYLQDGVLVELRPKGRVRFVDAASGAELPVTAKHERLLAQAIAYYQSASDALRSCALRVDAARRRDAAAQARPAERPQGRRDGFS